MAGERVCVYAVVSGAVGPLRATGMAGERLRRARVAGIDLVVGVVPRVPRPTPAALTRYDAAVRRLMETHGSVVPARYGTCAPSLETLSASVRDRRDAIRRTLRLVRHRVQMTVRIFDASVPGPASVERHPTPTPARSLSALDNRSESNARFGVGSECGDEATRGRRYLQHRAAEMQIPGAAPLRGAVRKWVRAERTERLNRGRLAGSVYHLVPRAAVPAYRASIQRAAAGAGLTVLTSGPWPPYAFAELDAL